tara:strand:- start:1448 stop:2116 length:669 start_codon:yes stop_codon:yes gene_type:complete
MNLANYYWYFESALTPKFCDEVIKHANSQQDSFARTGGYKPESPIIENFDSGKLTKEEIKDIKRKRNSNVVWLNDTWIYKEIHPYVTMANENAGWNFEWDSSENCQFTKYKLGQYYDWHVDGWDRPYERKDKTARDHGKIRKLSMTCQLTDGSEYTGGELEFDFRGYEPNMRDESKHRVQCKEILPKGSIIVFPSFVWHRVKPVTKGIRYSLVVWHLGYPFK